MVSRGHAIKKKQKWQMIQKEIYKWNPQYKIDLGKKEKWAKSRAKMRAKSFANYSTKEVLNYFEAKKKLEIKNAIEDFRIKPNSTSMSDG